MLLSCGILPASVANESTAPKAEAAITAYYTCVLKARVGSIGSPPYEFIASNKVDCFGAYAIPQLRISGRVYRDGVFIGYLNPNPAITSAVTGPGSVSMSKVVNTTTLRYIRCAKYTVHSDIYAYSTGKNVGSSSATLYTYC